LAQEVLSSLIFEIAANTASLTQGLSEAKGKINAFSKGVSQIKSIIAGAFAATAIIGAAKEVFEFSQQIGEARDKVRSLGLEGKELADSTAKARAISETFHIDFDKLLESARAVSKEFGISIPDALDKIKNGYAQTGSEEFLEILREYPAQFVSVGASADEAFALISQSINEGIYSDKGADAIKEAGLRLREMTPATKDALRAIGISSEELQASIADGSITTFQAIQKVSQRLAGFKDDSKQVGQVLADVFGGAGEDAGIRFIKMIGQANQSFDEMTAGVNDTVKAQLHLAQANEDLNKIWVSMFGESSVFWTELKADLLDIAVNGFKKIKTATVDVINYFLELYNQSLFFRVSVQQIIFVFKELWAIVKFVASQIIDIFSSTGKIIGAIFKGEFSKIPDLVLEAFAKVNANSFELGKTTGENFKVAIDSVLRKNPIKLITDSEVKDQVSKATNAAKTTVSGSQGNFQLIQPKKEQKPFRISEADLYTDDMGKRVTGLKQGIQSLTTVWSDFGAVAADVMGNQAVGAVDALSQAFTGMFTEQEGGFKNLVTIILGGIKQILQALLAKAIAGLIAGEATKGIVGLAIASIGVGALMALWNSKVPKFESGGIVPNSPFQLVGEKGAELVSLPTGSRVFNHNQTKGIFSGGGSNNLRLEAVVSGEALRFVLQETERRRG
jgi:hypothetical protein